LHLQIFNHLKQFKNMKQLTTIALFMAAAMCLSIPGKGQSNWQSVPTGEMAILNGVDFISEDEGIVVGMMGLILKTTDGGGNWTTIDAGMTNTFQDVQYIDNNRVIIGGDQGIILYSTDGGDNWVVVQESGQEYNINGIAVDPESGHGIAGGSGNTILWSDDFGLTWTFIEGGFMNSYNCAFMADGDFGIVIGTNAIFQPLAGYTMNGGQTWESRDYYPTQNSTGYEGNVYDAHFFSSNDGFTVGTTTAGEGFITTEVDWNSQMWDATFFPTAMLLAIDFKDNAHGVVVGGNFSGTTYVFETDNGGLTWEPASVDGDGNAMLDVVLVGNTGYAVGNFGEVLKKDLGTGVPDHISNPVKMYNYPNPSRESTKIFFELENDQHVEISLFDLSGKLVKKIFDAYAKAGNNSITLETSNLPGGVYYYRLLGEDQLITGKMIVE
jgi:photosystem II stability/assembly factor-like uncharacterized protein